MQKRVLTGKYKIPLEEKEQMRAKKQRIKDKWEMNNCGDYECIYPLAYGVSERQDKL
jgi:hypothetical protein